VDSRLSAPDSKAGRLQRACLELLREHKRDEDGLPTNAKFLFYEAEQRGVVPKHYLDARGHKKPRQPLQDITDALTYLRERGIVPWGWIEDPSRVLDERMFAASVYVYVTDAVERAQITRTRAWQVARTRCGSPRTWSCCCSWRFLRAIGARTFLKTAGSTICLSQTAANDVPPTAGCPSLTPATWSPEKEESHVHVGRCEEARSQNC
jgi:hypothetical protein